MKIGVVIPAYNEAESIIGVINEIRNTLKDKEHTIIVVDDGSKDNTSEVAKNLGAIVHRNKANRGVGYSTMKGLQVAKENNCDIIIKIDADGQHKPSDIPKLMEPVINEEADLVIGSRFLGSKKGMPLSNRIGNWISSKVVSYVAGQKITDSTCGFRVLSKEFNDDLNIESDFTYVQEMIIHAAKLGYKIKEIPIEAEERKHGKTKVVSSFSKYIARAAFIITRSVMLYEPLKVFLPISLLLFFAGSIWLMRSIILFGDFNDTSLFLLISSVLIFMFGLLADQISFLRRKK